MSYCLVSVSVLPQGNRCVVDGFSETGGGVTEVPVRFKSTPKIWKVLDIVGN